MNWFTWALLSAFFAGLTAVLAKVGVAHVDSNLATAIRTVVILIFAPVDKLSVVIAIALAAIFLHEKLTWHHWVGGLLIFTGAVVLAYA